MADKLILDNRQITEKIKRIAYEIYERNYDIKELCIVGIKDQGYKLAECLLLELKRISKIKFHLIEIKLDKMDLKSFNPDLSSHKKNISAKTVIFIDDVLNSGQTLLYAIKPFLELEPKSIQVAVLINRDNRSFPIFPDYTGLSLATTIQDHVKLDLNTEGDFSAHLS